MDIGQLQKLYSENGQARAVLDHFASRERNWSSTPVSRIQTNVQAAGVPISRGDVIEVFKALENAGCGKFKIGRKGWESRFEWTAQMVSVGQAAAGEPVKVEEVTREESEGEEGEVSLRHTFRLRSDLPVSFDLPSDLTTAEADRLSQFIRSLPFDRSVSQKYAMMNAAGEGRRTPSLRLSQDRPWLREYGNPSTVYDRDRFVEDYENWVDEGLLSSEKRDKIEIFRTFPEKIVFSPQAGLTGWGSTPLNPRCWTDASGNRLFPSVTVQE